MQHHILQLDIQGTPQSWITAHEAACAYATGSVAWEQGDAPAAVLRGGHNARTGKQSLLRISPIIALKGCANTNLFDVVPTVSKAKLLKRDRYTCAYCGEKHAEADLQVEHIHPQSRGGSTSWMNLVTADRWCNSRKANLTPEEARMPLLYLPYVPNRFEDFILAGRNIRADVHEWLASRLPKHSRLC